MTAEHKARLAQGRTEGRAVRRYLEALADSRPGRGRRVNVPVPLARVESRLSEPLPPLERLQLIQARRDLTKRLERVAGASDLVWLEAKFVEHAKSYGDRMGITWAAWREAGVSPKVLEEAGIPHIRRRRPTVTPI